jgi:hypothetical protein
LLGGRRYSDEPPKRNFPLLLSRMAFVIAGAAAVAAAQWLGGALIAEDEKVRKYEEPDQVRPLRVYHVKFRRYTT